MKQYKTWCHDINMNLFGTKTIEQLNNDCRMTHEAYYRFAISIRRYLLIARYITKLHNRLFKIKPTMFLVINGMAKVFYKVRSQSQGCKFVNTWCSSDRYNVENKERIETESRLQRDCGNAESRFCYCFSSRTQLNFERFFFK